MSQRSMIMVKRTYLQIGVMTLLTAILWMGVSVFQAITKTEIPNLDKEILTPVNPTIDEGTLTKINERIELSQIQSEVIQSQIASQSAEKQVVGEEL